jgi:glycosidase
MKTQDGHARRIRFTRLSHLILALLLCAGLAPAASAAPPATSWNNDWARGAVFYEVFVRSYADSDGNGIGDLRGLTGKLDYLKDLGVDALWLMPVFDSPSYHGYDTVDYEKIEPDYGTGEDFDRFLQEAHRRGIRVIVDFVMNHSSAQHPWFVESASSPGSPKRPWYVWRGDDPGWTQPWGGNNHTWHPKNGAFYYGVFWGGMPDLNFSTPAVRSEMERLAAYWLSRGVDGFRLDATRHLFANGPGDLQNDQPETHEYLKEFAAAVRQADPKSVLVGENWTTTEKIAPYLNELPMSFNFPLADEIRGALNSAEAAGIAAKLTEMAELYPAGSLDAPFLTNHDQARLATQLGNDPAKLRSAAAILLTLPGAPFLYYGEEVGIQNGSGSGDEFKRTPMPWDASAGGGFTTGKPWFKLRHASAALMKGDLKLLSPGDRSTPVLAFLRQSGKDRVLVVHNVTASEVEAGPYQIPGKRLQVLFGPTAKPVKGRDGWTVRLPAGASGVWKVR